MGQVGVIGAGAWGTAMGMAAQWAGSEVTFWDIVDDVVDQINQTHTIDVPLKALQLDQSIKAHWEL